MHFSRSVWYGWIIGMGLCFLGLGLLTGCEDNTTEQDEVFDDAQQRVQQNVLPDVNAEAEAVLRQLVNVLAIFPQVCATPLAELADLASIRDFPTTFPTLAQPAVDYNDAGAEWTFRWTNLLLGDNDLQRTDPTAAPADLSIKVLFQEQNETPLRAIPFSLGPQTPLQTVGVPSTFTAGNTEGYFLSQDAASGAWSLRWRGGNNTVFTGTVEADTGISRLIRHLADSANSVSSLSISENTQEVTFRETTPAGQENGFTFYARPGDAVQFRLRLGTSDQTVREITSNDLRIGAGDAFLPGNKAASDFFLSSSVPFDPTGAPTIVQGMARGTFLWQDVTSSGCASNEDQWRLRFTSLLSSDTFTGEFTGEDETASVTIRPAPVAPCSAGSLEDGGRTLDYTCTLGNGQLGGYDVCVPAGTRITAEPRINDVGESRLVFIGAAQLPPPSPDPFIIRFEVELEEQTSPRHVKFSNAALIMHGNNPDADLKLEDNQVSLEPPCVDGQNLRARLTEEGDYDTSRFEGSRFVLDQVEFLNNGLFPNRGTIELQTRVEEEETEIDALMHTVTSQDGNLCLLNGNICQVLTDVHVTVNQVPFTFTNQPAVLTVD